MSVEFGIPRQALFLVQSSFLFELISLNDGLCELVGTHAAEAKFKTFQIALITIIPFPLQLTLNFPLIQAFGYGLPPQLRSLIFLRGFLSLDDISPTLL